jgi:hypothetical protein
MDKETLIAEAILGKDAEEFINSELGQYMVGSAEQEAHEAYEALKKVLPWRRRKIQELQNKIWLAEHFKEWLAELVTAGKQAMDALDGRPE